MCAESLSISSNYILITLRKYFYSTFDKRGNRGSEELETCCYIRKPVSSAVINSNFWLPILYFFTCHPLPYNKLSCSVIHKLGFLTWYILPKATHLCNIFSLNIIPMPNSINTDPDVDIQIWHSEKQLLDYRENQNQTMIYADSTTKRKSGIKCHCDHKEFQTLYFLPAQ